MKAQTQLAPMAPPGGWAAKGPAAPEGAWYQATALLFPCLYHGQRRQTHHPEAQPEAVRLEGACPTAMARDQSEQGEQEAAVLHKSCRSRHYRPQTAMP